MMKLDKKKPILLALTLLAFFILTWQVYELVSSDLKSIPIFTAQTNSPITNNAQLKPTLTQRLPSTHHTSLTTDPQLNQDYLKLIAQYQFAKMQHKLLTEEVAIAKARKKLKESQGSIQNTTYGINSETQAEQDNYQLVYLDQQQNHWSATLSKNGHYYEISVGQQLEDGSQVIRITHQGVILSRQHGKFLINFNGVSPITSHTIATAINANT